MGRNDRHPLYPRWESMSARGGRDQRWFDFWTFVADIGTRPIGMYLSRADEAKPWGPDNWRWVDRQCKCTRLIAAGGVTQSISKWAATLGVKKNVVRMRLDNGWSEFDAVTLPKGSRNPKRQLTIGGEP